MARKDFIANIIFSLNIETVGFMVINEKGAITIGAAVLDIIKASIKG